MKILLFEVLRRIEWTVDPGYRLKMTPVSLLIQEETEY
jgi:unspecific monooxygenase